MCVILAQFFSHSRRLWKKDRHLYDFHELPKEDFTKQELEALEKEFKEHKSHVGTTVRSFLSNPDMSEDQVTLTEMYLAASAKDSIQAENRDVFFELWHDVYPSIPVPDPTELANVNVYLSHMCDGNSHQRHLYHSTSFKVRRDITNLCLRLAKKASPDPPHLPIGQEHAWDNRCMDDFLDEVVGAPGSTWERIFHSTFHRSKLNYLARNHNATDLTVMVLKCLRIPFATSRKRRNDSSRVTRYYIEPDKWNNLLKLHLAYDSDFRSLLLSAGLHVPEF